MTNSTTLGAQTEKLPHAASGWRQKDEALAASELRYRRLFETARDGILILDAETGMVVDVNPYLVEMVGYSHEQFIEKAVWELGFFKDAIASRDKFLELQRQEYVRYENLPLETADGRRIDVEFVSNVYLADNKKVIQCNIRNITDRKHVELQRELSRQVLAVLNRDSDFSGLIKDILRLIKVQSGFEAVGIRLREGDDFPYYATNGFEAEFVRADRHLCARDEAGRIIRDANGKPSLECMCGNVVCGRFDPSMPFFTPFGSFWTNSTTALLASTSEKDRQARTRNRCNGEGYESVALIPLRSGAEVIGLLQLNDYRKGMLSLDIVSFFEEIGESIGIALTRQRAAAANARLVTAVEQSAEIIVITDNNGTILYTNPAFEKTTGYTSEEVIGQNPRFLKSGKQNAEFYLQMWTILTHGDVWKGRFINKRKDGTLYEEDASISPVRDATGKIVNYVAAKRDVTHEVMMESQFRQAQKMEAVGRLAGGVAHDFNNLLMGIMGYAELCRDSIEPDHPIREWLDEITREAQRSAEITHQLLAFARKQTVMPKVLDLNDAVTGMLKLLRRLIGEDINLTWAPGMDLRPIKIDPSQIDQILANLCLNARDAIAGVGKISMETGNITIDADFCACHEHAVPGEYVFLAIGDNGGGMNAETLSHLFEPFFTTKAVGKGTGLGLATVYGIVEQNHGFICVDSTAGKGTTFTLYLPQVKGESPEAATISPAKTPIGRGETILMVEDEKSARVTCKLFLKGLGYNVLPAEAPDEALKLFELHKNDIQLLLTDVIMPGMDGSQLAKRITAAKPGIKVLFMSGYTADIIAERGILEKDVAFISKPFTRDELACRVREVLAPRGT